MTNRIGNTLTAESQVPGTATGTVHGGLAGLRVHAAFMASIALCGSAAFAQNEPAPTPPTEQPAAAPAADTKPAAEVAKEAGLPPAPNYSGLFWERATLTGDWGGNRNDLAQRGVTANIYLTQTLQRVVAGGVDQDWQYGGREFVGINLDLGRMKLLPGGSIRLQGEGNYGEFADASQTGTVLPANTNLLFPDTDGPQFYLSELMYMQFLSHYFGIFVGKLDGTAGDANAFADGKGERQFLNTAFAFNPIVSVAAPAYALGGGLVIAPTGDPHSFIITVSVMDMEGQASQAGFDTLFEGGTSYIVEGRYTTHFFGLTGHQLLGGMYSDREYTSLDQNLSNLIIPGLPIQTENSSWAIYYNFDQYVYQPDTKQDRGLGIFGRYGISDGDANPVHHFLSLGLGGKGLVPSRAHDQFGLGYFKLFAADSPTLSTLNFEDSQGFEAYYEMAITPAMFLTPDVQVIQPSQQHVDNDFVVGLRLTLVF
jgi:porin